MRFSLTIDYDAPSAGDRLSAEARASISRALMFVAGHVRLRGLTWDRAKVEGGGAVAWQLEGANPD